MANLPPLSLYIHIPWCVQKCPYCDFNSHALKGEVPHDDYVAHLLADLDADVPYAQGREVKTIFIGGGTPSLLSGPAMQTLLDGVRARLNLAADAEITMEANPGTVEADRFVEYQRAGVNRISIGVQSFSEPKLKRLGRIHGPEEAKRAANLATGLGLRSFNLDLMHGLPDQSLEEALDDLRQAIELNPPHLSWYQLTIEPNTLFGSRPPVLPDDEVLYELADLFRVFGDSTRIKILYALHDDELCVQDIANAVQLSQSAVSHQLRVLKDSKLVRFRRDGKTIYYALDDDHVRSILSMGMDHIEE